MSDESSPSRRRFVQALAAAGGLGLLTGAGTRAFMSDDDVFTNNRVQADQFSVNVSGTQMSGSLESVSPMETTSRSGGDMQALGGGQTPTSTTSDGSRLQSAESSPDVLSVGPLVPGQPSTLVVALGVETCDPADVWLRLQRENPSNIDVNTVASLVEVRVAVAAEAEFDNVRHSGLLLDLLKDTFEPGTLISSGCERTSSSCRPLFLGIEWLLPADVSTKESITADFRLDVEAQQCSRTQSQNPWSS